MSTDKTYVDYIDSVATRVTAFGIFHPSNPIPGEVFATEPEAREKLAEMISGAEALSCAPIAGLVGEVYAELYGECYVAQMDFTVTRLHTNL